MFIKKNLTITNSLLLFLKKAPVEADAQCAELCKRKLAWATATEDMDSLTLGTPLLLRHFTISEAKKIAIHEISLDKVLEGLDFTMDQFIDLCILLGCDYCESIRGIGPKRAVELVKKFGTIEKILQNIDLKKYVLPDPFNYKDAREMFKTAEIADITSADLQWDSVDEEAVIEFLVKEKNFNELRVKNALARLTKGKEKRSQGRIDSFFKVDDSKPKLTGKRKRVSTKPGGTKAKSQPPRKMQKRK